MGDRLGNSGHFSVLLLLSRFSFLSFESVLLCEGTRQKLGRRRRRRRCGDIYGCDRARWYDNWKRRRRREDRREMPVERTGNLMRNRGSRGPSGGRGGAGDGGRGRGSRGRWLPWLPETAVAATDDARGVTDSWQSYRVPTRTGCVSIYVTYTYMYTHAKHTYTCNNTHAATDRYV